MTNREYSNVVQFKKITIFDRILHMFGVHLTRKSSAGVKYCRICGKIFKH